MALVPRIGQNLPPFICNGVEWDESPPPPNKSKSYIKEYMHIGKTYHKFSLKSFRFIIHTPIVMSTPNTAPETPGETKFSTFTSIRTKTVFIVLR